MSKNKGKSKLSNNILFNANKHVFHCEKSLGTLFYGQPSLFLFDRYSLCLYVCIPFKQVHRLFRPLYLNKDYFIFEKGCGLFVWKKNEHITDNEEELLQEIRCMFTKSTSMPGRHAVSCSHSDLKAQNDSKDSDRSSGKN
jgi:hypothetical protein